MVKKRCCGLQSDAGSVHAEEDGTKIWRMLLKILNLDLSCTHAGYWQANKEVRYVSLYNMPATSQLFRDRVLAGRAGARLINVFVQVSSNLPGPTMIRCRTLSGHYDEHGNELRCTGQAALFFRCNSLTNKNRKFLTAVCMKHFQESFWGDWIEISRDEFIICDIMRS